MRVGDQFVGESICCIAFSEETKAEANELPKRASDASIVESHRKGNWANFLLPWLEKQQTFGPHQYVYGNAMGYKDALVIIMCSWFFVM